MIGATGLGARAGAFELREITFAVPRGAYGVVIGPAGSGKTTLLEMIAGIIAPTAGVLTLGDRDMAGVPPEERGIGFVYQRGFLFPHLTVQANIEYGAADAAFAHLIAERLGVSPLYARGVRSLSGGERALVAIARAVAARPVLLLLDEPYSALDPRRRTLVRREMRVMHREFGYTVLQVTHDFTEAGLLGDVAVLIDAGRVLQWGPPQQVFLAPASAYVAEFLGAENVFSGEVRAIESGVIEFRTGALSFHAVSDAAAGAGHAVVRADEISISRAAPSSSARNQFQGRITELSPLGALTRVVVDVGGTPLVAALTTHSVRELSLGEGQTVWASFKAMAVHLC